MHGRKKGRHSSILEHNLHRVDRFPCSDHAADIRAGRCGAGGPSPVPTWRKVDQHQARILADSQLKASKETQRSGLAPASDVVLLARETAQPQIQIPWF